MSLFFYKSEALEIFIFSWHDGEKQTIIPEAFHILESICGKSGGTHSHFGLGFRSHFNWLADIRMVRQKSWNGLSTESFFQITDTSETDTEWKRGGFLASKPAILTYIFYTMFVFCACVCMWACALCVELCMRRRGICLICTYVCVGAFVCLWNVPYILHTNVYLPVFRGE